MAGISNPYLSQIERGLKKPSAEILQALAKALRISAESLYVRAGILEERADLAVDPEVDVTAAVLAEPRLNDRQRAILLDIYESFLAEPAPKKAPRTPRPAARPSGRQTLVPSATRKPSLTKKPTTPQPTTTAQLTTTPQPNTKENQS